MAVLLRHMICLALTATIVSAGMYLPKRKYVFQTPTSTRPTSSHVGSIYLVENSFIKCASSNTTTTITPIGKAELQLSGTLSKQRILFMAENISDEMTGQMDFQIRLECTDGPGPRFKHLAALWESQVTINFIPENGPEREQSLAKPSDQWLASQLCPAASELKYDVIENSLPGPLDTLEVYSNSHHSLLDQFTGYNVRISVPSSQSQYLAIDEANSVLSLKSPLDREQKSYPPLFVHCHVSYQGKALPVSPVRRDVDVVIYDVDDNPPKKYGKGHVIIFDVSEDKKVKTKSKMQLNSIDRDSKSVTDQSTYHVTSNDTNGVIQLSTKYVRMPANKTLINTKAEVVSFESISLPYEVHVTVEDTAYVPPDAQATKDNKVVFIIRFVQKVQGHSHNVINKSPKASLDIAAAKYSLITKLESEYSKRRARGDQVEWKITYGRPNALANGFGVTEDGEVYLLNDKVLKTTTEISALVMIALTVNGERRVHFSLTVTLTNNGNSIGNMTCDQSCSSQTTEDQCTSFCGYGALTGRCVWRNTCTPYLKTCPDGKCSALEHINSEICPQDCNKEAVNATGTPQYQTSGQIEKTCSCDDPKENQEVCNCPAEQPRPPGSADSQNGDGNLENEDHTDTKCSPACRAGIASSLVLVLIVVATVVMGRIFWKRRQEQRQLPSLKHVNSLVSMSAIPSDYIVDDSRDSRGHVNRPPASQASGLWNSKITVGGYQEMTEDEWEFPRQNLSLENIVGEGEFGQVMKAKAIMDQGQGPENTKVVAVKMLKPDASGAEYQDLVSEFHMLKEVDHPNVIKLLGVCSQKGPLYVIVEYCELGSLRGFLRASKYKNKCSWDEKQKNGNFSFFQSHEVAEDRVLTSRDLFSFAWQIAKGMDYLAGLKIIHRDLAARNVLVKDGWQLKISDFGLSRDVYEANTYLKMSKGRIPVKWMAPESLFGQIYTTKSDTWSYGIVLWEIVTLGASPYPGIPPESLFPSLSAGYRMDRPEDCPEELYAIMQKCWKSAPEDRPRFAVLRDILDQILQQNTGYLELSDNCNLGPFNEIRSFPRQVNRDRGGSKPSPQQLTSPATKSGKPLPPYGNIIDPNCGQYDLNPGRARSFDSAPKIPVSTVHWHDDEADRESCPESSNLLGKEERTAPNLYENGLNGVHKKSSNNIISKTGIIMPHPGIAVHENLTYA